MLQKGTNGPMPKVLKAIVGVSRDTTEHWNAYPDFVPRLGEVIAYLDRFVITDSQTSTTTLIPDIKIGDGVHRLVDLPFAGDRGPEEINRSEIMSIFQSANISTDTEAQTPNYTPEGSITKPNVNLSYSVQNGIAAQCIMPELNMSVSDETLNIEWVNGSFITNTPTRVTSIRAELATTPVFTGIPTEIAVNFSGV